MDSSQLTLTVDIQNNALVSLNGSPTSLRNFFQSNTKTLRVQCVNPLSAVFPQVSSQSYVVQNMAAFSLRAAIGDTPEGVTGPTPLALQDTFVYDPVNNWFTGSLALNTTGIDTFLGVAASKTAYFELNLTLAGQRITILQTTFTLFAVVDELSGTVPTPTDKFLTAAETQTQFVPRQMENGATIVIPSLSGVYAVEIGCNDDATVKLNVITL